jgi:hypothetical protein
MRLLLAAALLAFAAGCGYRLQGSGGERFPDPAVRIDVSPFANASTIPDAGSHIAARLREELRRGGFRGEFTGRDADFVVEGKVREVREDVISHAPESRFALEYRLILVVDVRVVEVAKGRVLWKEAGLVESAPFYSDPDPQFTEGNRRTAFEEAGRRVTIRIAQTLKVIL